MAFRPKAIYHITALTYRHDRRCLSYRVLLIHSPQHGECNIHSQQLTRITITAPALMGYSIIPKLNVFF